MLNNYIQMPPTQDELPSDDGMPMETARHRQQMELLINQLTPILIEKNTGYVGGNMFIYFSLEQVKNQDFRGPDFYAVLGVSNCERKSWVVWEEGKGPDVVIELISDSTREIDKTTKKEIYQNRLRVPEYYWFDPFNPSDRAGFRLSGGVYEPIPLDAQGRLISQHLNLALVPWLGTYHGVQTVWLRWATLEGELLLTDQEIATQAVEKAAEAEQKAAEAEQKATEAEQKATEAEQKATEAEQKATEAEQKANILAAKLRELGINPDDL